MIKEMFVIARECVQHPRRRSIWSAQQGGYICPEIHEVEQREREEISYAHANQAEPKASISEQFKLVFLTAFGGTLLFALICVVIALAAGRQVPSLYEKVITGMFDLAKIGFGAVVGLLGGQSLQK